MSNNNDASYVGDDEETQPKDPPNELAELRAAAADGRRLRKENAFLRANVDLSKPSAQDMFKAWDGELTVEAIAAAATERGLITTTAPVVESTGPTADELEQQAFRESSGGGQAAGAGEAEHVDRQARDWREYQEDQAKGIPQDRARLALIDKRLVAAMEGDPGALFDEGAWLERRTAEGYDFRKG